MDDEAISELSEEQVEAAEESAVEVATLASDGGTSSRDLVAVREMAELVERSRRLPDARVRWLCDWIRREMCPGLPPLGAIASGAPAEAHAHECLAVRG